MRLVAGDHLTTAGFGHDAGARRPIWHVQNDRGRAPGFLHMPDRPSPRTPNPAPWGDSPSAHPTRWDFFSNAGAPQEKPCLYVSSGPSDAHAEWCVCLLNQQAHQGALITGVRAGHRSRGTRRKEPTPVRAGRPADWRPRMRGSPTRPFKYTINEIP